MPKKNSKSAAPRATRPADRSAAPRATRGVRGATTASATRPARHSASATRPARHSASATKTELTLAKEVKDLTKEVKKLKDMEFIKVLKHPWKYMGLSFLHGLMVGFGWVIGASVLVALLIYLLAQIQFVPYIGDFVTDVIEEVQSIKPLVEENINKKTEKLDTPTPTPTPAP